MNPSKPTYEQLRQILVGLGFDEESQRGVYIFFAVGDSEPPLCYAWHGLCYAWHEPDEPATAVDLTKAKSMPHWKRLLERDEFDNWATQSRLTSAAI